MILGHQFTLNRNGTGRYIVGLSDGIGRDIFGVPNLAIKQEVPAWRWKEYCSGMEYCWIT